MKSLITLVFPFSRSRWAYVRLQAKKSEVYLSTANSYSTGRQSITASIPHHGRSFDERRHTKTISQHLRVIELVSSYSTAAFISDFLPSSFSSEKRTRRNHLNMAYGWRDILVVMIILGSAVGILVGCWIRELVSYKPDQQPLTEMTPEQVTYMRSFRRRNLTRLYYNLGSKE